MTSLHFETEYNSILKNNADIVFSIPKNSTKNGFHPLTFLQMRQSHQRPDKESKRFLLITPIWLSMPILITRSENILKPKADSTIFDTSLRKTKLHCFFRQFHRF